MDSFKRVVITLAISLAGGLVGHFLDLPAGLLIGGALAVTAAAFWGVQAYMPRGLRDAGFVIIGMTLGTNVAQDSLSLMVQWPVTMIALAASVLVMVFASTYVLIRVFRLDRGTAYLSSFPGHLSFVLAMAESGYGQSRQIAVIQSIRIVLLTLGLPVLVKIASPVHVGSVLPGHPMEWGPLAVLGVACIAGGWVFDRMKMPAAYVLGSMIVAIIGKLMGLYEGTLPFALNAVGYVIIGGLLGSRFTGLKVRELGSNALAGLVVTVISVVAVTIAVWISTFFTAMPFGQIWLGLGPGALETMGILGVALGYDAAFIAAHHTARFLLLTALVPTVGTFVGKARPDTVPGD